MSSLLESIAVARRYEEEAAEILGAYINTQPQMAYNYSLDSAPAPKPAPTTPPTPGSSGGAPATAKTTASKEAASEQKQDQGDAGKTGEGETT